MMKKHQISYNNNDQQNQQNKDNQLYQDDQQNEVVLHIVKCMMIYLKWMDILLI